MNPLFDVDFKEFVAQVLGNLTRQPRMVAWLNALTAPARQLFTQVATSRTRALYDLSFTGQTIVLARRLNLQWPAAAGGIYILNQSATESPFFVYADNADVVLVDVLADGTGAMVYDNAAITAPDVNFIVRVPASLTFVAAEMRAVVDAYKLVGTSYRIETYGASGIEDPPPAGE